MSDPSGEKKPRRPSAYKPYKSGRKAGGRRSVKNLVIGDTELAIIARMRIRHSSFEEIGKFLGCAGATVRHHFRQTIQPLWNYGIVRTAQDELAKIDEMERLAWLRVDASIGEFVREQVTEEIVKSAKGRDKMKIVGKVTTKISQSVWAEGMDVLQWCSAERSRILGHYAAQRLKIDLGGDVRVSGKTREDIDKELMNRMQEVIAERMRVIHATGAN